MTIEEFRIAIFQAMLAIKDNDGNQKIDEKEARELLQTFTDDDLEFGIQFDTPEEIASMLVNE